MDTQQQPLNLDFEEQVARIRRAQLETDKFAEETRKLVAEARKLDRDRFLAPSIAASGFFSLISGLGAGVVVWLLTRYIR